MQCGQIRRTSRCAIAPTRVELIRKRSTPRSSRRVMAEAASLVCRVEKTRWPVSAAWIGVLGGLEVADLADHDDVRVLAQDVAQRGGEGDPDLGLHLRSG